MLEGMSVGRWDLTGLYSSVSPIQMLPDRTPRAAEAMASLERVSDSSSFGHR